MSATDGMRGLLMDAAERASAYLESVDEQRVAPSEEAVRGLAALGGALPERPTDPREVVRLLDEIGGPATVANAGRRWFGFVNGGSVPASVGAALLASAWDQNAGLAVSSPVAARLEEVAGAWLLEMLGLPRACAVGFVTGATMANFTAVCAARHALLERAGWDVEAKGLYGAPEIRVVVGAEFHSSAKKVLALAGLGRDRVETVPVDGQGRLIAEELPDLDEQTLVLTQAGNVNTGAFDPVGAVCERAREAGAWVHVDGAFGLWAAASPAYKHLTDGVELADSWALDAHKWLNVPYDSGLVVCRHGGAVKAGMASPAAYLVESDSREPYHFTPELSRRARGIEVWAAMRSLGRSGVAEMIERCCACARRFADKLSAAGFEVLNDVMINQVMVSFGAPEVTRRVIEGLQREGTCWCGGTRWQGREAMRISVSSWKTTEEDVDRCVAVMVREARKHGGR